MTPPQALDRQTELGFMFDHSLLSELGRNLVASATSVYALAELLVEHGLIDATEYAVRREAVGKALAEQMAREGLTLALNEQHADKYALDDLPEIDCASRLHLCHAACCRLRFPLSRQDVEEGVVRWDLGQPYLNRRDDTGYCVHCDHQSHHCGVYANRPAPCRVYDCRADERIWEDFDAMVVSPDLQMLLHGEPNDQPEAAGDG